jgi:hypothetical protein
VRTSKVPASRRHSREKTLKGSWTADGGSKSRSVTHWSAVSPSDDVYAAGGALDAKKTCSRRGVMVPRWIKSQPRMASAAPVGNSLHESPAWRGDGSMPAWLRKSPEHLYTASDAVARSMQS